MKKLILILLVYILGGCGYAPMDSYDKTVIITEIEQRNGSCCYYGEGNSWRVNTITSWDFKFIDSCGKFQIGDTILFIKK